MSDNAQEKITYLVGKFADAFVFVGDGDKAHSINAHNFRNPVHEISHGGNTYHFIDPEHLSSESLEDLTQKPETYVFEGSLSDRCIDVSSKGIKSYPVSELAFQS